MCVRILERLDVRLARPPDDKAESAAAFPGHTIHRRICLHGSHGATLWQNSAPALPAALAVS
jgi:hypothetical protein